MGERLQSPGAVVSCSEDGCTKLLISAVDALRDIAAMSKKVGSETAANWLLAHGFALTDGGYIPGRGFPQDS